MTQISRGELKARLISYAQQIGFDSCRIAACTAPTYGTEFRAWLREGAHGEMNYMERGEEKRCDPQKVLPGARSIVVLALNYFQGKQVQASEDAKGKIARYAWGDDYHQVVESKLDKIETFLRDFGGQQKCYVDTGPILERDQAAQAGIGWHGKSTMLIDEQLGTWFFLAEILTTLELLPDQPVADRCGTCERCIKACPTGAITAPHRLDARRCISYLTIELKGSIPLELRLR
jgi:epoxyqueuosine reductase